MTSQYLMFWIFVSFSLCDMPMCEAPLNLADPPKKAKLLQVQVLIRHGARTPGQDFYNFRKTHTWLCDDSESPIPRLRPAPVLHPRNYHTIIDKRLALYPPSCGEKDLLNLGMKQHIELGQLYRQRYVEELNAIPEHFSPHHILIRATEADRTLKSAMAFIQGMFPPVSPNEVVQIMTDTSAAGLLHPKECWCRELNGSREEMIASPQFQELWKNFSENYQEKLGSVLKKWTPSEAKSFCSWLTTVMCDGYTVPAELEEDHELHDACFNIVSHWHFAVGRNESRYVGAYSSPLFREMFRMADETISLGSTVKFVLLSSHDTALSSLLATLGWDYSTNPGTPVRSHIAFELWELDNEVYARFVFNGVPVKVDFLDSQEMFTYSSLKTTMSRLGLLSHCFIPEWR